MVEELERPIFRGLTLRELISIFFGVLLIVAGAIIFLLFLPTVLLIVPLLPLLFGIAMVAGGVALIGFAFRSMQRRATKEKEQKISYKIEGGK